MSETWRQRLSRRRLELGIEGSEYDYIQKYIEFYCSEADRRCKKIDMNKTVDEVINSMKDEKFDRFTKKGLLILYTKSEAMILMTTVKKKLHPWFHNDSKRKLISFQFR